MLWDDVIRIALTAIAGVGGIAGVLYAVIKFSADRIAERLSAKYELKMNKELERFKNSLDKKNYVSKTRFDVEFKILREFSVLLSNLWRDVYSLFPTWATVPSNEDARKELEDKNHEAARASIVAIQDELGKIAAFITQEMYEKFAEILALCKIQLDDFQIAQGLRVGASDFAKRPEFSHEVYSRTRDITKKHEELVVYIREYLQSLEVIGEE